MGMFDSIFWVCPACNRTDEMQTKIRDMPMCDEHVASAVPVELASSMAGAGECWHCKAKVVFRAVALDVDEQTVAFEVSLAGDAGDDEGG